MSFGIISVRRGDDPDFRLKWTWTSSMEKKIVKVVHITKKKFTSFHLSFVVFLHFHGMCLELGQISSRRHRTHISGLELTVPWLATTRTCTASGDVRIYQRRPDLPCRNGWFLKHPNMGVKGATKNRLYPRRLVFCMVPLWKFYTPRNWRMKKHIVDMFLETYIRTPFPPNIGLNEAHLTSIGFVVLIHTKTSCWVLVDASADRWQ